MNAKECHVAARGAVALDTNEAMQHAAVTLMRSPAGQADRETTGRMPSRKAAQLSVDNKDCYVDDIKGS